MNEANLHALVGNVLQDLGGAFSVPLVTDHVKAPTPWFVMLVVALAAPMILSVPPSTVTVLLLATRTVTARDPIAAPSKSVVALQYSVVVEIW